MASAIDPTKPASVNASTADERANWATAKVEIEALQAQKQDNSALIDLFIAGLSVPPLQDRLIMSVDGANFTYATSSQTMNALSTGHFDFGLAPDAFCATNAAGPCMMDEAATATNPTFVPNQTEPDTGWGWLSDSLIAVLGGISAATFNLDTNISRFILADPLRSAEIILEGGDDANNRAASIAFRTNAENRWAFVKSSTVESGGDAGSPFSLRRFDDTGASLGDVMTVTRADGSVVWTGNHTWSNAAGPSIRDEAATTTNPTLIPNWAELDTGWGWASDTLIAVLGGLQRWTFSAGSIQSSEITGPEILNEACTVTNPTLIPFRGDLTTGVAGSLNVVGIAVQGVAVATWSSTAFQINGLQTRGGNAAAFALVDEVSSAINPTLIPDRSELGTGLGGTLNNWSLIRVGVEQLTGQSGLMLASVDMQGSNAAGPAIMFDEAATGTNPTLIVNKAELDTGWGWLSDTLVAVLGGVQSWTLSTASLVAGNASGPALLNEAASATNPTFAPNKASLNDGLGSAAAGTINLITAGVSRMSIAVADMTKGKIFVADGAKLTPVGVGSNADVLTADSAEATGVKWAAPAGGAAAPIGMVAPTIATTAPTGWLLCDGASTNATTQEALFLVIVANVGNFGTGTKTGDITTDFATDDRIDLTAHGLAVDELAHFTSTGTLPGGLNINTAYYVITVHDVNSFSVSLTKGGVTVDITSNGTGTHSVYESFLLPDMRGRAPLGKDDMGGASANRVTATQADNLGQGSGAEDHTLVTAELPGHSHNYTKHTTSGGGAGGSINQGENANNTATTNTGSDNAHSSMQPYQTLNYIIKT